MTPFRNRAVAAKFDAYPPAPRTALLALRELIYSTAADLPAVHGLEETLKWGEPAYLTTNRVGSTLRIDWKERDPERYAMYCHCQTSLVETFRTMFPQDFEFEGNRALLLRLNEPMPADALRVCIEAALGYHLKKSAGG